MSSPTISADILIVNGEILTMNSGREIIVDGAVAIKDTKLVAVGSTSDITGRYAADVTIDARGSVVMPGLIDGHNHPVAYLLGGISDDIDVYESVWKHLYVYEAALTPEQTYLNGIGTFVEMIKFGTTCFNDPGGYHVESTGRAAVDVGIRGILNRSTRDFSPGGRTAVTASAFESFDENLTYAEETVKQWNGAENGRLRAWVSLRNVFNVSDSLIEAIRDLATRYGVGVHSHVASIIHENEGVEEIYGKRSLQRYYDLGLFGPNLYVAHGGFPSTQELDWLCEHDVKVAHCPIATVKGAWGIVQNGMIPKMIERGMTVSLGTDTVGAAGSLDMFKTMFTAATCHREKAQDPSLVGAYKALEMATIDGAKACLWDDEIGSLEPGKKADVILVDTNGPAWLQAGRDTVRKLVYATNGTAVSTVIIDGRVVMRDRKVLTVDEEALREEIVDAGRSALASAGLTVASPWPRI